MSLELGYDVYTAQVESLTRRGVMAQAGKAVFELDVMEKQWVHKSLVTQRNVLVRSRLKETPGTEIHTLRGKEIDALTFLIQRFV